MLDALAVLTAARNRATGRQIVFPDPPNLDGLGLPMAINC